LALHYEEARVHNTFQRLIFHLHVNPRLLRQLVVPGSHTPHIEYGTMHRADISALHHPIHQGAGVHAAGDEEALGLDSGHDDVWFGLRCNKFSKFL
jgi:hypothetical protein